MHIVAVAWLFVVVLMAAAEAMDGSVVGAAATLIFYGLLPLGITLFLLATPSRRRARARREALAQTPLAGAPAPPHSPEAPALGSVEEIPPSGGE
jgi:hypothetical protein